MEALALFLLAIPVVIILFSKVNALQREVDGLKSEVRALREGRSPLVPSITGAPAVPMEGEQPSRLSPGAQAPGVAPGVGPLTAPALEPRSAPGMPVPGGESRPAVSPAPVGTPQPAATLSAGGESRPAMAPAASRSPMPPAAIVPRTPSPMAQWFHTVRTTDEWEALIGGRWLNRIGALALILGVGFFLKYAFDRNLISETFRVAIGVVTGAALLLLAARTHRRGYAIFAQGLVGAGTSILYLSIYASFNFFHLVPQGVALTALALVTALAFAQALYYDSLAVSLLAWAGGFLTPVLLMTDGGSAIGQAIYVGLLVLGILALLIRKDEWIVLEPLTLLSSYGVFLLWCATSYHNDVLPLALAFSVVLWGLFFAKDVWDIVQGIGRHHVVRAGVGSVNAVVFYCILAGLLASDHRPWLVAASLVLGAVYCTTILAVQRVTHAGVGVAARYALTATALLVLATVAQTDGFALAILWSLEAAALLGIGIRWRLRYVWMPALGLYGLSLVSLFAARGALSFEPLRDFQPILNQRALAFAVLAAVAAAGSIALGRLEHARRIDIQRALQVVAAALLFFLLTVEEHDLFAQRLLTATGLDHTQLHYSGSILLAGVWALYSVALLWLGLRRNLVAVTFSALGSIASALCLGLVVGASYMPIERFTLLLNVRAGVLVLLIGVLALHARGLLSRRGSSPWVEYALIGLALGALTAGFELITVETQDFFARRIAESSGRTVTSLGYSRTMILAALWMIYAVPLVMYGRRRLSNLAIGSGIAVAGVSVVTVASAGLRYAPIPWFVPVLNARALALVVVLAGLFSIMAALRALAAKPGWLQAITTVLPVVIVLLGFELVTGETWDIFRHTLAEPGTRSADEIQSLQNLRGMVLSVVWLVYAALLMGLGISRRQRWLRFGALGLFGVTILKVFFYDLSFLGGAYRSISFAGLGVILLGVSFLYQRYRDVLFGREDEPASTLPPSGTGDAAQAHPTSRVDDTVQTQQTFHSEDSSHQPSVVPGAEVSSEV